MMWFASVTVYQLQPPIGAVDGTAPGRLFPNIVKSLRARPISGRMLVLLTLRMEGGDELMMSGWCWRAGPSLRPRLSSQGTVSLITPKTCICGCSLAEGQA